MITLQIVAIVSHNGPPLALDLTYNYWFDKLFRGRPSETAR